MRSPPSSQASQPGGLPGWWGREVVLRRPWLPDTLWHDHGADFSTKVLQGVQGLVDGAGL